MFGGWRCGTTHIWVVRRQTAKLLITQTSLAPCYFITLRSTSDIPQPKFIREWQRPSSHPYQICFMLWFCIAFLTSHQHTLSFISIYFLPNSYQRLIKHRSYLYSINVFTQNIIIFSTDQKLKCPV